MNTQVFYDFGCENKKVIESQWDKLSQPFIPNYSTEGYPLTIAEANGLNKKITTIELNYSTLHFNFAKVIHFTLHTNKESIGIVCETEQGNYYTLKSNLLVDVIQGGGMSKQSHTYKTSWGQPVEVFAIRSIYGISMPALTLIAPNNEVFKHIYIYASFDLADSVEVPGSDGLGFENVNTFKLTVNHVLRFN